MAEQQQIDWIEGAHIQIVRELVTYAKERVVHHKITVFEGIEALDQARRVLGEQMNVETVKFMRSSAIRIANPGDAAAIARDRC